MADETPDSIQRWKTKRRTALILSILKGEASVAEAAGKQGLSVAEVEDWRDRFLGRRGECTARSPETMARRSRRNRSRSSNRISGTWCSTMSSYGGPSNRTLRPGGRPTSEAASPPTATS